ncbi:hypothetical protein ACUH94_07530 [Dermabacteraceae bacterium P7074]
MAEEKLLCEKEWGQLPKLAGDLPAIPDPVDDLLRAVPVQDALGTDDNVVLLADNMVYRLDALTGTVWSLLGIVEGTSMSKLVEGVVEILGPHPESTSLVEDACDRLRENGLLRG